MSKGGIPGGRHITGSMTPVPMSHRVRRRGDRFPRNLSSGEWEAIEDGHDDASMPGVQSRTYVSPMEGQPSVDSVLVRQNLLKIGVQPGVLEGLDDRQAEILARMMLVDCEAVSAFLESPVLSQSGIALVDILDDVSHFMILGSDQWANFFYDSGFLSDNVRRFKTTAASLHCATRYAPDFAANIDNARFGAILYTGFDNYFGRGKLMERFVPSMIRSESNFNHMTAKMAATVAVPGRVVAHTVRVGKPEHQVFNLYGRGNSIDAQQTLLGHRLLAMAFTHEVRAPMADVVVFGGNDVHQGWCEEMQSAAERAGVTMRLRTIASRGAPMITMTLR